MYCAKWLYSYHRGKGLTVTNFNLMTYAEQIYFFKKYTKSIFSYPINIKDIPEGVCPFYGV